MTTITEAATATIEHVAPDAIVIEDNVREAIDLPKEFVASIKTHGVLQPVLATRAVDGTLRVRDGQRRTLAAREAGVATIPAYVTDAGDDAKARIVQQIVANDQRDGLNDRDRTRGFAALALDGMSVAAIAKATGHKRDTVDKSVRIAKSDTAASLFDAGSISLEAAAILAEFDDDAEALAALTEQIERYGDHNIEWEAKRWQQRRAREAAHAAIVAEAEATGVRIVTDEDTYRHLSGLSDEPYAEPTDDEDEDEHERPAVDAEAHAACGGHALKLDKWSDQAVPVCTTPEAHYDRWSDSPERYQAPAPVEAVQHEDEDDDARAEREAAEAEARKAERRETIANNRAWRDAEPVRREWLATFLQRKTMPKDATAFAATVLAATATQFGHDEGNMACTLVGQEAPGYGARLTPEPNKPVHALVALAFASVERGTDVHTWKRRGSEGPVVTYLAQIAAWGYPLSDVEKVAAGIEVEQPTEA